MQRHCGRPSGIPKQTPNLATGGKRREFPVLNGGKTSHGKPYFAISEMMNSARDKTMSIRVNQATGERQAPRLDMEGGSMPCFGRALFAAYALLVGDKYLRARNGTLYKAATTLGLTRRTLKCASLFRLLPPS
jgi:hypothetical protein